MQARWLLLLAQAHVWGTSISFGKPVIHYIVSRDEYLRSIMSRPRAFESRPRLERVGASSLARVSCATRARVYQVAYGRMHLRIMQIFVFASLHTDGITDCCDTLTLKFRHAAPRD